MWGRRKKNIRAAHSSRRDAFGSRSRGGIDKSLSRQSRRSGTAGGAISVRVGTTSPTRAVSINHNTFTGNAANNAEGQGYDGAIAASTDGPISVNYNRFFGNMASSGTGSAIHQAFNSTGTIDARFNWWGCNEGPTGAGCDTIGGVTANITTDPRLFLTHTASPNPINAGQSTTLTASFLRDSKPA